MHTIETRIGDLTITINVNADWSGDAEVTIRRWDPIVGGEWKLVGCRELPTITARDLLAGRYVPRPAFTFSSREAAPSRNGGGLVTLDEWGAAVAAAVFSATIDSATAAVESVRRPGQAP
jgi:hypothetical protein